MRKNKKYLLILLPVYTVLVALAAIMAYDAYRVGRQRLFDYPPEEVTGIFVNDTATLAQVDITGPETVREVVETLNGFTYSSVKYSPPAGYSSLSLTLKGSFSGSGNPREFDIGPDFVRFSAPGSGSIIYTSAKPGYFQPLVELIGKPRGKPRAYTLTAVFLAGAAPGLLPSRFIPKKPQNILSFLTFPYYTWYSGYILAFSRGI